MTQGDGHVIASASDTERVPAFPVAVPQDVDGEFVKQIADESGLDYQVAQHSKSDVDWVSSNQNSWEWQPGSLYRHQFMTACAGCERSQGTVSEIDDIVQQFHYP